MLPFFKDAVPTLDQESEALKYVTGQADAHRDVNPYHDQTVPVQYRKARLRRDIADVKFRIAELQRSKAELQETLDTLK